MTHLLPQPDPIQTLPIVILLIKSSCNCRCTMCDIWLGNKRQELPATVIAEMLSQFEKLGTREIALSGGEPLMHTEIEKICRDIKDGDFKLTLLTTGLLLNRHAEMVNKYVDQIYVSLDGPEELHNNIRNIPDCFGKIYKGINAIRKMDQEKSIGGRCTIHRQNFRYLSETVNAARQLTLDSISFLAADVQADHFGRDTDWHESGLALTSEELSELRTALDKLYQHHATEFENGYIIESRDKLERKLYGYYQAMAGESEFPPVRCNAPWVSTVIETDGCVRPCFFHRTYTGNINSTLLPDILNSDSARKWRSQLDTITNITCKKCVCSIAHSDIEDPYNKNSVNS